MYNLITLLRSILLLLLAVAGEPARVNGDVGSKVIGVFDNSSFAAAFTNCMSSGFSQYRFDVYLTPGRNQSEIYNYLCSTDDVLFIYSVLSSLSILHTQILSAVASVRNIPVFIYDGSLDHGPPNSRRVDGDLLFYMNGDLRDEGMAISEMVSTYNWPHVDVLVQSELQYDGFLNAISKLDNKESYQILFSKDMLQVLPRELVLRVERDKHYARSELIILHTTGEIGHDIIRELELFFYDKHLVWILSQGAGGDESMLTGISSDVIMLKNLVADHRLIEETLKLIIEKFARMRSTLEKEGLLENTKCDQEMNYEKTLSWRRNLDEVGLTAHRKLSYYRFSIKMKTQLTSGWVTPGRIDSLTHGAPDIKPFLSSINKQLYTTVTIFDLPFVTERQTDEFDGEEYCPTPSVTCLIIPQSVIITHGYSSDIVKQVFVDFYAGERHPSRPYTRTCCEGLSIELLKSLSSELEFEYQVYVVPDGQFGAFDEKLNNWTGLVKEIMDGRADMVLGSFSITSLRSAVIDYSVPWFHSGFSLLAINREETDTKWFSYLDPYPLLVWVMVIVCACVAFVMLAVFEWFSPRGINPLRDKEKRSYTLSSAIKAVFSLMSGNTISTKAPKSWAGRWMQNVWGFFSIIYLAGYTANLTSAIADGVTLLTFTSIYDDKLLELQVASTHNGAIEQHVKTINPTLYDVMKNRATVSMAHGLEQLRNGDLDVFIKDTPVIDYVISHKNSDCVFKKVLTFAVDSFGVAFPQNKLIELKSAVNSKFLEYHETGYIERLRKIYFSTSNNCKAVNDADQIQLKFKNAAGLFLTLAGFIPICFLLIGVEHFLYSFVIPHAKRQPSGSLWRTKSLMFFSQRIHRAIEQDGKVGRAVIREFFHKLYRLRHMFTAEQLSFRGAKEVKVTFYDVVSLAYEKEKKKPLSSIFLLKDEKPSLPSLPTISSGMRGAAMLSATIPFAGISTQTKIGKRRHSSGRLPFEEVQLETEQCSCFEMNVKCHDGKIVQQPKVQQHLSAGESLDVPGEYSKPKPDIEEASINL